MTDTLTLPTEAQITENRRKAVEALRTTTETQGSGALYSSVTGCYCAVGIIAKALGCDPKDNRDANGDDLPGTYDFVERQLGIPFSVERQNGIPFDGAISEIYRLNDTRRMTFFQIGDALAAKWGIS